MNRSEKQQLIDELHEELEKAPNASSSTSGGSPCRRSTEFRRKVRASGSRYRVVKNTLALRAAKGTALERLEAKLEGTTGVAYTGDDPVALAKVLIDFAKDNPALSCQGRGRGRNARCWTPTASRRSHDCPSLPELRAKLLGLLQAPATQLVRLLGTPATQTSCAC